MPEPIRGALPWLLERAGNDPDCPALRCDGLDLTFEDLARRTETVAGRLAALGIGRGDRVVTVMDASVRFVELFHAAQRLGVALVPLNTRLAAVEIARLVADARPRVVLYEHAHRGLVASIGGAIEAEEELDAVAVRSLPPPAPVDPEAVLAIVYTSGTTGEAKGSMLTNACHLASATASRAVLGAVAGDRWLAMLPLFHVGGLSILVRSVIDGAVVTLQRGFDAGRANRAIREEGVTLVSVVATMLARMLDEGGLSPGRLRHVLVGGGPVPLVLLERSAAAGIPVAPTYGLTEACSQVATATLADALAHPESAGRPLPGTTIRIAGPGSDGVGEILVRGPTLMTGYLGRPEATAAALRDGWLHTGDLGRLDDQGFLYVHDRRADLVVSGGENVYPAEVEAVLLAHPDVAEAAVYAMPDARWGQRVAAAVVRRPGGAADADGLRAWCAQRLGRFKVPRAFRFVTSLPRTASGKIRRHRLKR